MSDAIVSDQRIRVQAQMLRSHLPSGLPAWFHRPTYRQPPIPKYVAEWQVPAANERIRVRLLQTDGEYIRMNRVDMCTATDMQNSQSYIYICSTLEISAVY
jgi:hypothetical protein